MSALSELSFYKPHQVQKKSMVGGGREQAREQKEAMMGDFQIISNNYPRVTIRKISGAEKSQYWEIKLSAQLSLQDLIEAGLQGEKLKRGIHHYLDVPLRESEWAHRRVRKLWHASKLSRIQITPLIETSVCRMPRLVAETLEKHPGQCQRALQQKGMARLLKKAPSEQRGRLIRAVSHCSNNPAAAQTRTN